MEQYIIIVSLKFLIFVVGFGLGRISMFKQLVNVRKELDDLKKEILIFKHNLSSKKGRIIVKGGSE